MPTLQTTRLTSTNLDEIAQEVGRVYCPHDTKFERTRGAAPGLFEIRHTGHQPVSELRYGVRAKVDAGEFPGLMLMHTCLDGSGLAHQQGASVTLRKGETLPMSAGLRTQLEMDARFAQRSVRLDIDRLEAQCARMLNHPLDRQLRFELRPFAPSLERIWAGAVDLLYSYSNLNVSLPAASAASFDEFVISLVLALHPHSYSEDLHAPARALPPRLIREAEHLMSTGDNQLTVSEIAACLRVSLRSLEAGFREYRRTTPSRRLREIRLEKVREILLAPDASTSVTSTALECGFVHLARFSGYYKAAFGETPAQTLRRRRRGSN
jgi:AraC-like DNA-binding protein